MAAFMSTPDLDSDIRFYRSWKGFSKAGLHSQLLSRQLQLKKNKTAGPTPCRLAFVQNFGAPYLPLLTTFFSSFPGVNLATLRAAILMVAPVCGFRPLRALRCETENVPNPIKATRSPFLRAAVTLSTAVS